MKFSYFCLGLLWIGQAAAVPMISIQGTIEQNLPTPQPKKIKLLKVSLSKQAKTMLKRDVSTYLKQKDFALVAMKQTALPARVQLGMNHVPVLDQGEHGACVTFAVTALFDALIGEGDYVSQLCILALGNHIANNSTYRPSGWDGSSAAITLARFAEYGIVSKEQEKTGVCGGLTEYPKNSYVSSDNEMTLVDYHRVSENSAEFNEFEHYLVSPILRMDQKLYQKPSMEKMLMEVKTALYHGDRVLIGMLLPVNKWLGLDADYHSAHDTWVLTGRTEYFADRALWDFSQMGQWGGHEMIITGFDDNAVAVDGDGVSHKGLLTLRNSWGTTAGDHGTFYMSYDYFKVLAIDLIQIGDSRMSA